MAVKEQIDQVLVQNSNLMITIQQMPGICVRKTTHTQANTSILYIYLYIYTDIYMKYI